MRKIREYLHISQPAIDITDPCYDADMTWCRKNNMPIEEGNYEVVINQFENDRNHSIILIKEGLSVDDVNIQEVDKGTIGVDAGIAGFFESKPDYPDKEWHALCDYIREQDFGFAEVDSPFKCNGVWCESGWGDGEYPVTQLIYKDKVVGYRIDFMEEE